MTPQDLKKLYDRVTPSLVAVQFVWESELGRRELVGGGIVVGDDGLIMTSMQMFDLRMPDVQMKEFKINRAEPDGRSRGDRRRLSRSRRAHANRVRASKSTSDPQSGRR
jgi:hypothetical protein